jgi:predicted aspartyl protease
VKRCLVFLLPVCLLLQWSRTSVAQASADSDREATRAELALPMNSKFHPDFPLRAAARPVEPDLQREIRFQLSAGYLLLVRGRIGQMDGLQFVLDTGTTYTIIDRKIAKRLGLPRQPSQVLNLDRAVRVQRAELPDLQLGPIHLHNFAVIIADLGYFSSFAARVDGVIGLDILRLSTFTVDYGAREVYFGTTAHSAFGVPMTADTVCLTVPVEIGGRSFRLLVDTGVKELVLYETRTRSRIPALRINGEAYGLSLEGRLASKVVSLPSTQLGPMEIERTAFLVNGPNKNALPGVDGYLGTAALKARRVTFDFSARQLRWEK